jgi:hypothetical protein
MSWTRPRTKIIYWGGIYESKRKGYLCFVDSGKFHVCRKRAEEALRYFQNLNGNPLEIVYTKEEKIIYAWSDD